ncbi:uncharacterized protein LOC141647549 [Silene latifolia]|uniref:uncharacterized protein LOC141647549 n=1 Tax=Silene latifolia TaxID=37657 RepID=UPI003D76D82A
MDFRVGLLVLIVFAGNLVSDARDLATSEGPGVDVAGTKIDVCTLCEQYVTVALDYLTDEKTQNEVLEALHKTCSQMHNLADQCMTMVDQYAETFFSEISSVQPEGICKKVGLCRNSMVSSLSEKKDKCDVCHQAVNGVIDMLKDPDTELGIIERLLKACNAVSDRYKHKCKNIVFEFGPVLLVDAGSFFEKLDICSTFHACTRHQPKMEEAMIEMVTSSSS